MVAVLGIDDVPILAVLQRKRDGEARLEVVIPRYRSSVLKCTLRWSDFMHFGWDACHRPPITFQNVLISWLSVYRVWFRLETLCETDDPPGTARAHAFCNFPMLKV